MIFNIIIIIRKQKNLKSSHNSLSTKDGRVKNFKFSDILVLISSIIF